MAWFLTFIGMLIGVITIFLGIWIAARFAGKLKRAVIFLIIGVAAFIIEMISEITNFLTITASEIARNIFHIAIILFIFIAILNMKQTIDEIDGKYKKR